MNYRACAIVVLLSAAGCSRSPDTERSPLAGAWQEVEFSFRTPDTAWAIQVQQPSLYLFLNHHHSISYVPGDQPRQHFAEYWHPSPAEKIRAYETFWASAGTYTYNDSSFTTHPLVAKNPNFMATGSLTYFYQLRGDSLILWRRHIWSEDTTKVVESRRLLHRLE